MMIKYRFTSNQRLKKRNKRRLTCLMKYYISQKSNHVPAEHSLTLTEHGKQSRIFLKMATDRMQLGKIGLMPDLLCNYSDYDAFLLRYFSLKICD